MSDVNPVNNNNGLNSIRTANNPLDVKNNTAGPVPAVVEVLDPLELQEAYRRIDGSRFAR